MIWHHRPWRLDNAEYYGELSDANNGHVIIVERGLKEDEILHNMRQSIANFDPHQMYTEDSVYNLEAKTRGGIIVSPAYTYKECVKY